MLVMMGVRTEEHCLRSQVGIGSESDCLLGQLCKILEISDSEAIDVLLAQIDRAVIFGSHARNENANYIIHCATSFEYINCAHLVCICGLTSRSLGLFMGIFLMRIGFLCLVFVNFLILKIMATMT